MIRSYLHNRTYSVVIDDEISNPKLLKYGVPQGSILGPMLYLMYTKEIEKIVNEYGLKLHVYADDCSIYMSFTSDDQSSAEDRIKQCLYTLKLWMAKSFLKLNSDKTVVKLFKPNAFTANIESFNLNDENGLIQPSDTAKLLGVTLSQKLNFVEFVQKKIQICNLHLRNLRSVRNCIPHKAKVILVTNLIFSNIDYCNGLLLCSPGYLITKLQRTLNKAIRFVFNIKREEHITPYLFKLHILPLFYRIKFKMSLIAYKMSRNIAPAYLNEKNV